MLKNSLFITLLNFSFSINRFLKKPDVTGKEELLEKIEEN